MACFADHENNELLACAMYLEGRGALPVESLESPVREASAVCESSPFKTTDEELLFNDMFASFLNTRERGHVIAVAGGFRSSKAKNQYRIIAASNAGKNGVHERSDPYNGLCSALAQDCTMFVSGNNTVHGVLVAALNICHAEVASSLKAVNTDNDFTVPSTPNIDATGEWDLWLQGEFRPAVAALEADRCLEAWNDLPSQKKIDVATQYSQVLDAASELWENIGGFSFTDGFKKHAKPVRKFNNIAKGLGLLRRFPSNTNFDFYWPQDSISGGSDHFICQSVHTETTLWKTVIEGLINRTDPGDHTLLESKWRRAIGEDWEKPILHTDCKLHCEIYLALYILFLDSNVMFHSFRVAEEGKQVFAIGATKASCIACWDILLKLSRQDYLTNTIYICRTRRSHGKAYAAWGIPHSAGTLPPSLDVATEQKRTQMLDSLNLSLSWSRQTFEQRVIDLILDNQQTSDGHSDTAILSD